MKNMLTNRHIGTKKPTTLRAQPMETMIQTFQRTTLTQQISCGLVTLIPTPVETLGLDTDETGTMLWFSKMSI